jgi:hypothetical protein
VPTPSSGIIVLLEEAWSSDNFQPDRIDLDFDGTAVFINLSNNQSRDSLAIQTFLFFGKLNMGSGCPQ